VSRVQASRLASQPIPTSHTHPPAGMGASYGTAKSGVGIASMGVMRPELVMKSIVPVVMAGVLGIYGLIIAVIISTGGALGCRGVQGRARGPRSWIPHAHARPRPRPHRSEPRHVHPVRRLCAPGVRPGLRAGGPSGGHGHRHRGRRGRAVGVWGNGQASKQAGPSLGWRGGCCWACPALGSSSSAPGAVVGACNAPTRACIPRLCCTPPHATAQQAVQLCGQGLPHSLPTLPPPSTLCAHPPMTTEPTRSSQSCSWA